MCKGTYTTTGGNEMILDIALGMVLAFWGIIFSLGITEVLFRKGEMK